MNGKHHLPQIVPAAILIICASSYGYANPKADIRATEGAASSKPSTLTETRKDAAQTRAHVVPAIELPLYVPPSRGQVRVRSSAATRGIEDPQEPTVAALDL